MGDRNLNVIQVTAIIVGAGITGSLLTYLLNKNKKSVYLVDRGQEVSSSAIAAGIINPVTGKNFVKSWGVDTFLPKAKDIYRQWEEDFGQKIVYPLNIVRKLPTAGAENIWESRKLDGEYNSYVESNPSQHLWNNKLFFKGAFAEIKGSIRVDIRKLIQFVKAKQLEEGLAENEIFDYNLLTHDENGWQYKNIRSQYIIFCEGAGGIKNPFFKNLPFALTRGYAVEIKSKNHGFVQMFKDEIFLVPLDEDNLWAGGAYSPVLYDMKKDESEFAKIFEKLEEWYRQPFNETNKKSAVRPTTKTRRPIIQRHPERASMIFLNGMGTKGTSMAPLITEKLSRYICGENGFDEIAFFDFTV